MKYLTFIFPFLIKYAFGQNSICPQDGIKLPDSSDCTKYFECKNGIPVSQQCFIGLKYNCMYKICMFDIFTPCCQSDPNKPLVSYSFCPLLGLKIPNPLTCNKYFECSGHRIAEETCPIGQKYDWLRMQCWSVNSCTCAPGTEIRTTITTPTTSTSAPALCPQNGIKLPNNSDCRKYFECENGKPRSRKCPYGTVYNCFHKMCTPKRLSECCKNDLNNVIKHNNYNCFVNGIKAPYPFKCDMYFECDNFKIVLKTCPPGQKYDWIWETCVSISNCRCAPNIGTNNTITTTTTQKIQTPTINDSENVTVSSVTAPSTTDQTKPNQINFTNNLTTLISSSTESKITSETVILSSIEQTTENQVLSTTTSNTPQSIIKNQTSLDNICPQDGIRLPDNSDCEKYFECINGRPQRRTCPYGFVYNCFVKECTLKSMSECCRNDPTGPPIDDIKICFINNIKVPYPLSCHQYFECVDGEILIQDCRQGLKYDWLRNECVYPHACHCTPNLQSNTTKTTTSTTEIQTTSSVVCPQDGVKFPDVNDCHNYFECVNGQSVKRRCPLGFSWNCWARMCTLSIINNCCNSNTNGSLKISCYIPNMKMPNPADCSSYYECDNWFTVKKFCPTGEKFDFWTSSCKSNKCTCAQNITDGNTSITSPFTSITSSSLF